MNIFLGATPIGTVDNITYDKSGGSARFWQETHFPERDLYVSTAWFHGPAGVADQALSIIKRRSRYEEMWSKHYDMPVSAGGLQEAHNYLVAQVREGKLP